MVKYLGSVKFERVDVHIFSRDWRGITGEFATAMRRIALSRKGYECF
jgi:hypothetical protein